MFSYFSNLTYEKRIYFVRIRAFSKTDTAVVTFFSFIFTARDYVTCSSRWPFGSIGEECRIPTKWSGLLGTILAAICQAIELITVLELLPGSVFDEVLGYVAFERAGDIDWCASVSIGWLPYESGTPSVHVSQSFIDSQRSVKIMEPGAESKIRGSRGVIT